MGTNYKIILVYQKFIMVPQNGLNNEYICQNMPF